MGPLTSLQLFQASLVLAEFWRYPQVSDRTFLGAIRPRPHPKRRAPGWRWDRPSEQTRAPSWGRRPVTAAGAPLQFRKRAPTPVTRGSPEGLPGSSQSPERRLAFPSPSIAERAPGPHAAGGPRGPQTVLPPSSCPPFPPGGVQEGVIPASTSTCPADPYVHPQQATGRKLCSAGASDEPRGARSSTRGTGDWSTRGLWGRGQAPVPGPQVHVKVRQQVPGV